ncbi:hypothetical protein Tco_0621873 [Tanacetum coccineum]
MTLKNLGFVSSLVFCSWISLGLPYHTLDAIDGYRRRKIDGVSDKFSYWMSKGSSNLVEVLESLQALSDLYYLFDGFMCLSLYPGLNISNFGPADRGKENGIYILQSIDHGPFELRTTRDTLGTTPEGGLPKDIYKLINHNIEAKAIWDNVKMLLAGSELTKEDRESQLYDEFECSKMLPGENINEYYVWFHKLVNDIRNIRMTMPNIQLNSKFVNNLSSEWDRFVTTAKLNKGLKETNHEKLSTLPQTNNQVRTSSNTRNQGTVQDGQVVVQNVQGRQNQNQRNFARGNGATCNGGAHNRELHSPKRSQNSNYFKDKMLLMQAQENGAVLDEEELLFLAGEQTNTFDAYVDNQPVHDLDNVIDPSDNNQVKHEIHKEVQQITIIDLTSADMGNSNVIPYEQYLTVNDVSIVPNSVSSIPNDEYV